MAHPARPVRRGGQLAGDGQHRGGPLGISELLYRASTVPTYLEGDWFRDWGALQRLDLFYPNAQPARLALGTATRSGLWSPAPLRPT